MPDNGRLVDFRTIANSGKRVWVRADCDGTPDCVVEVHIEAGSQETEVHLNPTEVKMLRKGLKRALKVWKANH